MADDDWDTDPDFTNTVNIKKGAQNEKERLAALNAKDLAVMVKEEASKNSQQRLVQGEFRRGGRISDMTVDRSKEQVFQPPPMPARNPNVARESRVWGKDDASAVRSQFGGPAGGSSGGGGYSAPKPSSGPAPAPKPAPAPAPKPAAAPKPAPAPAPKPAPAPAPVSKPAPPPPASKPAPPPPAAKPPPKAPEPEPEPQQDEWGDQGYDQGGYDQGGYDQGGYDQGGYDQGGYDQGGYDQGGYDQGDQGGYDQGGYDQGGYDQGGAGGQQAEALYDFAGETETDLPFYAGDVITVLDTSDPSGWWEGELNGVRGFFPSNFVQLF